MLDLTGNMIDLQSSLDTKGEVINKIAKRSGMVDR
jgi:hypothetical protein